MAAAGLLIVSLAKTENGRKNTAAKQLSSMAASCGWQHYESYLKNGAPNQEAHAPIFIRAHIQLAGHNLTNNHTFKLLSGLLMQTLYKKNITLAYSPVNPKLSFQKRLSRDYARLMVYDFCRILRMLFQGFHPAI